MNIVILGGFLGSGKTTVLAQLAEYLVKISDKDIKTPVVILENEISESGVDNQFLSGLDLTVENVFSGCICCTSTASLTESVNEIRSLYDPRWLLIEATGMAYPDNIKKVLSDEMHMHASILALADASRWRKVMKAMPDFISYQIKCASVILLNKIDLTERGNIEEAKADIRKINSEGIIFETCAAKEITDPVLNEITNLLCGHQ